MGATETPAEDRIADYLARAEEARHHARRASDPEMRKSFETIAEGWEQLATHTARLAKRWDSGRDRPEPDGT